MLHIVCIRVLWQCVIQTSIQSKCGVALGGRGSGWLSSEAAKGSASDSVSENKPIFSSTVICQAPAISRMNYTHMQWALRPHGTWCCYNPAFRVLPGLQLHYGQRAATPSRRWPSPCPAPWTSSEETSRGDAAAEDPILRQRRVCVTQTWPAFKTVHVIDWALPLVLMSSAVILNMFCINASESLASRASLIWETISLLRFESLCVTSANCSIPETLIHHILKIFTYL